MRLLPIIALLLAHTAFAAQQDNLASCLKALSAEPRFATLASHIAVGDAGAGTAAMLQDSGVPTEKERKAIADWADARASCVKAADQEGNAAYRPPLVAHAIQAENKVLAAAVELYERRITYGDFNRRRQAIEEERRSKSANLSRQMYEQRSADRQAREVEGVKRELQEAERQAALAQQQALEAQQAQDAAARRAAARAANRSIPPPAAFVGRRAYSDCYRFGGRFVCTR
jgi:hypothetical protein